ncbi:hypothetical protein KUCAC02_005901, partial [Chaenocephalus aceratus]
ELATRRQSAEGPSVNSLSTVRQQSVNSPSTNSPSTNSPSTVRQQTVRQQSAEIHVVVIRHGGAQFFGPGHQCSAGGSAVFSAGFLMWTEGRQQSSVKQQMFYTAAVTLISWAESSSLYETSWALLAFDSVWDVIVLPVWLSQRLAQVCPPTGNLYIGVHAKKTQVLAGVVMLTVVYMVGNVSSMSTCKTLDLEMSLAGSDGGRRGDPVPLLSLYNSTKEILTEQQSEVPTDISTEQEEEEYFAKVLHKFNMTGIHTILFYPHFKRKWMDAAQECAVLKGEERHAQNQGHDFVLLR